MGWKVINARFWKLKRKGNGGNGEAQGWPVRPLLRRENKNGRE